MATALIVWCCGRRDEPALGNRELKSRGALLVGDGRRSSHRRHAREPQLSLVFFACQLFLALKEYLSAHPDAARRPQRAAVRLSGDPGAVLWAALDWYGMFIIFIPVYMFLLFPARMVLLGDTQGFLRAVGTLHWGLMTTVFTLSHMAMLLVLPPTPGRSRGSGFCSSWSSSLSSTTSRSTSGASYGPHRVIPKVSPNKTWEGLLGGVATTTLVAAG